MESINCSYRIFFYQIKTCADPKGFNKHIILVNYLIIDYLIIINCLIINYIIVIIHVINIQVFNPLSPNGI